MEMRNLIPGLPDELASECLIRIHFESFPNAILTCKNWKHIIGSPGYLSRRIVDGHSQSIAIMSLREHHWDVEDSEREAAPDRLVVCEPRTGIWSELPPIPGSFNALPFDRNMIVVGSNLVVIGGRLLRSSQGSKNVFIYSFISNAWRHGADMLDALLASWCVSDSDRTLYVVGIFYEQTNLMMSALAYDVVKDDWVKLPDMDTEDEMGGVQKVTFLSGKLNVFRLYSFRKYVGNMLFSVQTFDPATMMWGTVCKYVLNVDNECVSNPKVAGLVGNVHVCKEGAVAVIADEKCQKIADLPIDGCDVSEMLTWKKHLAVYTASIKRGTNILCLLDSESKVWSNFEVPRRSNSDLVHDVCTAEI